jgi:hypothetical protein
MKIMVVETTNNGRTEVAFLMRDIIVMANIFENSNVVTSFYVDGLNAKNQQQVYGANKYTKWISPISQ